MIFMMLAATSFAGIGLALMFFPSDPHQSGVLVGLTAIAFNPRLCAVAVIKPFAF
jgi:hypothetical protein